MEKRIDGLDYLRGLMALGIMIYHYNAWIFGVSDSSSPLSRLGIYGVSTFYVLSGLTLFLVYSDKLNFKNLNKYFIKRVFRIYPLLWISILMSIFLLNKAYETKKLVLNFSGAFGFVAHNEYISAGAWSIGNELVFYVLFPLVVFLSRKIKFGIWISFAVSVIIGLFFAFYTLDDSQPLIDQWKIYIHPMNQLFLFVGGILIGSLWKGYKKNGLIGLALLLVSALLFIYWPVSGDRILLITDFNRIIFAICAFLFTTAFLLFPDLKVSIISPSLKILGQISYSIYLIHPIVFWYMAKFINRKDMQLGFFAISIVITILISLMVYYFIEKQFILLGKRIVDK